LNDELFTSAKLCTVKKSLDYLAHVLLAYVLFSTVFCQRWMRISLSHLHRLIQDLSGQTYDNIGFVHYYLFI